MAEEVPQPPAPTKEKYTVQRQLREAFRNAIRKDSRLAKPVPPVLLHYTTIGSFYSITSSHSLRASRAEMSNDTGEMTLAATVVEEVLQEREARTAFTPTVIDGIKKSLVRESVATMVTCFTEPKKYKATEKLLPADILSMWRAYGASGEGVAVHFDGARLERLARDGEGVAAGSRLLRVIYDPDDQFDLIKRVVTLARPELFEKLPSQDDEWTAWAVRAVATELSSFAAMFKHSGFSEENEWRLVCNVSSVEMPDIGFVDQQGVKRGCIHLIVREDSDDESDGEAFFAKEQDLDQIFFLDPDDWQKDSAPLPAVGVTIGPSGRQREIAISALDWARHRGYAPQWKGEKDFPVLQSQIPFRS